MPNTQSTLNTLLDTSQRAIAAHVHHFTTGQFSVDTFGDRMLDTLLSAHTQAVVIGRHHAGDTTALEEDDRQFALHVLRGEEPFLVSFLDDLEGSRYKDEQGQPNQKPILARALLYAGLLIGTANEVWALTTDGPLYWRLGEPETEHCQDCPALAAGSPYTADTLPTYPRRNDTQCLQGCLCWVEDAKGGRSFENGA